MLHDIGYMRRGFSLVEVILSTSLFVLIVTALLGAYAYSAESGVVSGDRARATYLAEEGLEAVRNIRDTGFSSITNGTYGLDSSSGVWNFNGSSDVTSIFTRELVISTVRADRKKIEANITWPQTTQRPGSVSLVTYLTNWMAVAAGNWGNPVQESGLGFSGIDDGWKVQAEGNLAVAVRQTGSPDFVVVDIFDTANPSILGSLNLADGQEDVFISGNYAYVASRSNGGELQIIDISNPSAPSLIGSYNAPGTANAMGIYFQGSTAYLVRASSGSDEFLAVDVSSPTSPVLIGSLNLGASNNNSVVVFGGFAYVVSDDGVQELRVIDLSVPSSPTLVGSLNLPGGSDADAIDGLGSMVTIGRVNGDIYTIDVSAPASPSILGLYNNLASIRDVYFESGSNLIYVASDENTAEFLVVDVTNPSSPALLSFLDLPFDLNGIYYLSVKDRVFAVGDGDLEEFIVITPQ